MWQFRQTSTIYFRHFFLLSLISFNQQIEIIILMLPYSLQASKINYNEQNWFTYFTFITSLIRCLKLIFVFYLKSIWTLLSVLSSLSESTLPFEEEGAVDDGEGDPSEAEGEAGEAATCDPRTARRWCEERGRVGLSRFSPSTTFWSRRWPREILLERRSVPSRCWRCEGRSPGRRARRAGWGPRPSLRAEMPRRRRTESRFRFRGIPPSTRARCSRRLVRLHAVKSAGEGEEWPRSQIRICV